MLYFNQYSYFAYPVGFSYVPPKHNHIKIYYETASAKRDEKAPEKFPPEITCKRLKLFAPSIRFYVNIRTLNIILAHWLASPIDGEEKEEEKQKLSDSVYGKCTTFFSFFTAIHTLAAISIKHFFQTSCIYLPNICTVEHVIFFFH